MHFFFTSINNAYLPKAEILVRSLRSAYGGTAHITCMLSDVRRDDADYAMFDDVLTIDELALPTSSLEAWIFKHGVVELCTAVKPWAFKKIMQKHHAEAVIYLDPDTVVYSSLDEVHALLKDHPVILTPHVTSPAVLPKDLLDSEMLGALRHGVFNLGFLALASYGQGVNFLDWWADRCLNWCYHDSSRGLFTDQRWIDLAPCFFPSLHILSHPGYNLASWNLYYRKLQKDSAGQYRVNGDFALRFLHFSGFDSGTHQLMLDRHASGDLLLAELTQWYSQHLKRTVNAGLRNQWAYESFGSGRAIGQNVRTLYRDNPDLIEKFPNPVSDPEFELWLNANYQVSPRTPSVFWRKASERLRAYPRIRLFLKQHLPVGWLGWLRRRR